MSALVARTPKECVLEVRTWNRYSSRWVRVASEASALLPVAASTRWMASSFGSSC